MEDPVTQPLSMQDSRGPQGHCWRVFIFRCFHIPSWKLSPLPPYGASPLVPILPSGVPHTKNLWHLTQDWWVPSQQRGKCVSEDHSLAPPLKVLPCHWDGRKEAQCLVSSHYSIIKTSLGRSHVSKDLREASELWSYMSASGMPISAFLFLKLLLAQSSAPSLRHTGLKQK